MPDIFYVLSKWWKKMLAFVLVALAAVALLVFLQQEQYLSVATALPASPFNADKGKIFNEHTEALYPAMGSADELDKIVGTAQLDTVYISIARQFDLAAHYKINTAGTASVFKAAIMLKKNSSVLKSDYGELKVKVWDTDKQLAPQLANAIMAELDLIHRYLQNENNVLSLANIAEGQKKINAGIDSIQQFLRKADITAEAAQYLTTRRTALLQQALEYEKLINQYQVTINNNTSVLSIVEKARVSDWPDKPRRIQILIATAFISFVFAFLLALLLERKKMPA